jgi:cytochrome P450
MVIQEVLRLYSPGWMIPRTATTDDEIDGVRIPAGSTVLISPYLSHRLPGVWPDPAVFDPERFTPQAVQRRHRSAYLPFGGGPHACVGSHFFLVEAQLTVAAVLRRFRPRRVGSRPVRPAIGASLRPAQRILVALDPIS